MTQFLKAPALATGWRPVPSWKPGVTAVMRAWPGKRVTLVALEEIERGGKKWRHVSVSSSSGKRGRTELPTWEELMAAKRDVLGLASKAIMVLPAEDEHYSLAEVLHLWQSMDEAGDGVPDLRNERGEL